MKKHKAGNFISKDNKLNKSLLLDSGYSPFPRVIMRMKEVSSSAKIVLSAILDKIMLDGSGACFPSYKTIADSTGLSRPTISKCLKEWKKIEVLDWEKDGYSCSNRYCIKPLPDWVLEKYGYGIKGVTDSNFKADNELVTDQDLISNEDKDYKEGGWGSDNNLNDVINNSLSKTKSAHEDKLQKRLQKVKEKIRRGNTDAVENKNITSNNSKKQKNKDMMTFQGEYARLFSGKYPEMKRPIWSNKEVGQIRNMIKMFGGLDEATTLMEYIFYNWSSLAQSWKIDIDSIPTIGIMMTYGRGLTVKAKRVSGNKGGVNLKFANRDRNKDKEI